MISFSISVIIISLSVCIIIFKEIEAIEPPMYLHLAQTKCHNKVFSTLSCMCMCAISQTVTVAGSDGF